MAMGSIPTRLPMYSLNTSSGDVIAIKSRRIKMALAVARPCENISGMWVCSICEKSLLVERFFGLAMHQLN